MRLLTLLFIISILLGLINTQLALSRATQIVRIDYQPPFAERGCPVFNGAASSIQLKNFDSAYYVTTGMDSTVFRIEFDLCTNTQQCTADAAIGGFDIFGGNLLWSRQPSDGVDVAAIVQIGLDDVASCATSIKCLVDLAEIGPIATMNEREVFALSKTSSVTGFSGVLHLWDYPDIPGGNCINRRSYSIPEANCLDPQDISRLNGDIVGILCRDNIVIGFNFRTLRFADETFPGFSINPLAPAFSFDVIFPRTEEERSSIRLIRRESIVLEPPPEKLHSIEEEL